MCCPHTQPGPLLPRREARGKPPRLARTLLNSTAVGLGRNTVGLPKSRRVQNGETGQIYRRYTGGLPEIHRRYTGTPPTSCRSPTLEWGPRRALSSAVSRSSQATLARAAPSRYRGASLASRGVRAGLFLPGYTAASFRWLWFSAQSPNCFTSSRQRRTAFMLMGLGVRRRPSELLTGLAVQAAILSSVTEETRLRRSSARNSPSCASRPAPSTMNANRCSTPCKSS